MWREEGSEPSPIVDTTWLYMPSLDIDPETKIRSRARQLMELGRYGRQDVLSLGDCDIEDVNRYHDVLRDVLDSEKGETTSDGSGVDMSLLPLLEEAG